MKLLMGMILGYIGLFLKSYVLACTWNWFIVPWNMPELPYVVALGFTIIYSFMTIKLSASDLITSFVNSVLDKDLKFTIYSLIMSLYLNTLVPITSLFIIWVIHCIVH
jgi:hypothetical protein